MEKQNSATTVPEVLPKIHILDLGSKKRKAIKDLKNGTGKLMADVEHAVAGLPDDKNRHVVIVICKKKRRKGRSSFSCSPLSPLSFFR